MPALSIASFLLLLVGCAPRGEPVDSAPPPGAPAASGQTVGVVRIVGSAPMNLQIVLQPDEGGSIRLTGPLSRELEQLAGVRLAVEGSVTPSPDPIVERLIEVTGYSILAVDGLPVVVGEIVSVDAGIAMLRTETGEQIELRGVPESFRVGQRVWVQGPRSLTVQSFGLIR